MGCTLNYTPEDHSQIMRSLEGRPTSKEPLDKDRREEVRAALNRISSERLLPILSNPHHPAYQSLSKLLAISVGSQMTQAEMQKLPEAFSVILKDHPNALGIFVKAPLHRGPGTSPLHQHYEIFSAAALKTSSFKTELGKTLHIERGDRVDFGIKFAKDYAQPKRAGTIEADILVNRGLGKSIAIDAKFSRAGKYAATEGLQRQLDGIRTGFRDEKIQEFCFVTNGVFGKGFKDMVREENLVIAKDYAKIHNMLYHDEKHGFDTKYLTKEERESIPPDKMPLDFFREYNEKVKEFVHKYEIPQVEMCEHVKYPRT